MHSGDPHVGGSIVCGLSLLEGLYLWRSVFSIHSNYVTIWNEEFSALTGLSPGQWQQIALGLLILQSDWSLI